MECDTMHWYGNIPNEGSAPSEAPWVDRLQLPPHIYSINEIDFIVLGQGVVPLTI